MGSIWKSQPGTALQWPPGAGDIWTSLSNQVSGKKHNGMDDSYSSCFESDDDKDETKTVGRAPRKSSIKKKGPDLEGFSKTDLDINFLGLKLTNKSEATPHPKQESPSAELSAATDGKRCAAKEIKIPDSSGRKTCLGESEKELVRPAVLYFKRNLPSFRGSAAINRRRKLQQIEHENMVNLNNLHQFVSESIFKCNIFLMWIRFYCESCNRSNPLLKWPTGGGDYVSWVLHLVSKRNRLPNKKLQRSPSKRLATTQRWCWTSVILAIIYIDTIKAGRKCTVSCSKNARQFQPGIENKMRLLLT